MGQIKDLTARSPFTGTEVFPVQLSSDNDTRKGTVSDISSFTWASISTQLIDVVYPVGIFYTQYPDALSSDEATAFPATKYPAALIGGGSSWTIQFSTENTFFRTAGTDYQTRTGGISVDQMQGHYHQGAFAASASGGSRSVPVTSAAASGTVASTTAITYPIDDSTNGTPRTGAVTEPRNRLIKVWKRTA